MHIYFNPSQTPLLGLSTSIMSTQNNHTILGLNSFVWVLAIKQKRFLSLSLLRNFEEVVMLTTALSWPSA